MKKSLKMLVLLGGLLPVLLSGKSFAAPVETVVGLEDVAFDMAVDKVRSRLYVSMPERNEVAVVSLQTFEVLEKIVVGSKPKGLDVSLDGTTLYVALNGAGAVAYVDLDTLTVTDVIDVGVAAGSALTYDVIEAKPHRIFVSASPNSSGFAYIVMIKSDQGNSVTKVASNRIIRAEPTFAADPNQQALYIGEQFSPNSLYKLDITTDLAPIVLEDVHGTVSGTRLLDTSPDGARIYLGSGQILSTATLSQEGLIGAGPVKVAGTGDVAYVLRKDSSLVAPVTIDAYNTGTFLKTDAYTSICTFSAYVNNLRIDLLPDNTGWLVLGDNKVCAITTEPPKTIRTFPASGAFLSSQNFDLSVVADGGNLRVEKIDSVVVDGGIPLSYTLTKCQRGVLDTGETTYFCNDFGKDFIRNYGEGVHTLDVNLTLEDGSILTDLVRWEILHNNK